VASAVRAAQQEGSAEIREEHLLAAVLDSAAGARALTPLDDGSARSQAIAEIGRLRRSGGYTAEQRTALSSYGVDLDEVVSHVEARLGNGVLDERTLRRSGGPRLSLTVTEVIERAAREATDDGSARVDVAHLAMGLVGSRGVVGDVLAGYGLTVAVLRTVIQADRSERGRGPR
jgi:ATP-dependent Clp protease ATP-binding subunit ClpA